MAVNDTFHENAIGVADAGEFIVDGSGAGTGAAEVFELGGTGDADVYRETDTNADGTFDLSVKIDDLTGEWHSQLNQLVVSQSNNHRIRVLNVSGASADYYATGMEVDD